MCTKDLLKRIKYHLQELVIGKVTVTLYQTIHETCINFEIITNEYVFLYTTTPKPDDSINKIVSDVFFSYQEYVYRKYFKISKKENIS